MTSNTTDRTTAATTIQSHSPAQLALGDAPVFRDRTSPLSAAFRGSTWRAFGFLSAILLIAPFAFLYAVTTISLGLPLAVLFVGLVVPAALILGARGLGSTYRHLTNKILGTRILPPPSVNRQPGFMGFIKTGLGDSAGWRTLLYGFLSSMTSLTYFILSLGLLATGLGALTYPVWRPFLPAQQAPDGSWHRGSEMWPGYFIDTPGRMAVFVVAGAVLLFLIWPAVNNGLARLEARMAAALLGPTKAAVVKARFEQQRDQAATATTNQMRAIERDLHDVTQAQLVAIAMKLGDVRDRLESGESVESIAANIAAAHNTSKEALTDLRSLVRGIHPAALDAGLDTALQTLASRSALPVALTVGPMDEVTATAEAVAYYCAAELLNNVAKHSGAQRAELTAYTDGGFLILTVRDEGRGGAHGLTSVWQRVDSIGGNVTIDSPHGGPTSITVTLPRSLAMNS